MTRPVQDQIKECNDQNVPLSDFQRTFCNRCLNEECTRSSLQGDRFARRTSTWVERLFTETPRMDSSDPRFQPLSAQNFVEVVGRESRIPEIGQNWIDPLNPEPVLPEPKENSVQSEVQNSGPRSEESSNNPNLPMNSPRKTGILLNQSSNPSSSDDPWSAPAPQPKIEGTVVKPGARVRFSK